MEFDDQVIYYLIAHDDNGFDSMQKLCFVAHDDNSFDSMQKLSFDDESSFTFAKLAGTKADSIPMQVQAIPHKGEVADYFSSVGPALCLIVECNDMNAVKGFMDSFMDKFAEECEGSFTWICEDGLGEGELYEISRGSKVKKEEWKTWERVVKSFAVDVDSDDEPLEFNMGVYAYEGTQSPVMQAAGLWFIEDMEGSYRNPLLAIGYYAEENEAVITNLRKIKTTLKFILKHSGPDIDWDDWAEEAEDYYEEKALDKILAVIEELQEDEE